MCIRDSLINTTEVIMTNRFEGMTTEQAAAEIVSQIEEQGGMAGFNLSLQN